MKNKKTIKDIFVILNLLKLIIKKNKIKKIKIPDDFGS